MDFCLRLCAVTVEFLSKVLSQKFAVTLLPDPRQPRPPHQQGGDRDRQSHLEVVPDPGLVSEGLQFVY